MEYIRPKLKINRYKKQPPNILFQNIAQEIDHATRAKLNFSLDYDLLLWLIRLISLNPVYGTAQNRFFDRAAVDALITDYLEIVSAPDNLFVATVRMQVYFINNHIDKNRIIEQHEANMNLKMKPLTHLIISTRLKGRNECDDYVKKLAVDIIAYYGLGNPENAQVVQETVSALKSMMSMNDVMAFSALGEKDKIESLSGIREIVCGMRAFNKDAGHCGEGLVDIENTVRNGYKATKSQLNASLKQIASCIERLVGALGKQSIDRIPSLIEKNNVIKAITLNRQCERFLYDLLNSLAEQQVHIDRHLKTYRSQLNKIHEIVKFRTAIPISSIFPKFIELAKLWEQLQHQTYILSEINTVNGQLMLLAQIQSSYKRMPTNLEAVTTSPNHATNDGVNEDKTIASERSKIVEFKNMIRSNNEQIKIVPFEAHLKVEFEAFCALTLSYGGLLLQSDLKIGLIQYENQLFAFSSLDAAESFMQNPDTCLQRIIEVICQNAELALFFDMYDALEQNGINTNQGMAYSAESGEDTVDQCSVGVQTELHPMPYIKDKKYTWNMWDMRRMAIKLADLQKCATKSTQTINQSSFGTQTHSERDLSK